MLISCNFASKKGFKKIAKTITENHSKITSQRIIINDFTLEIKLTYKYGGEDNWVYRDDSFQTFKDFSYNVVQSIENR